MTDWLSSATSFNVTAVSARLNIKPTEMAPATILRFRLLK